MCLDEVVRDGKENGVTPLVRQGQLGGLQLARNSRASVQTECALGVHHMAKHPYDSQPTEEEYR